MVEMIQNLMLIDDDEDDREIFLTIVKDSFPEFSLSVATNGQEALQNLQNIFYHSGYYIS
jgi:CheY-like chemotaxis protein